MNAIQRMLLSIATTRRGIQGYAIAALLTGIALLLRLFIWPVDAGLQYVTFFPTVTIVAVIAGLGPAIFSSMLGAVFALYFFMDPYYSFSFHEVGKSIWSSSVFLLDGVVVSVSIETMHRYRQRHMREHEELRAVHAELQRNSQYYKNVFDNVLDGIITINESGIIESFNRAAEGIFGYSAAEVLGNNVAMLMPEPHRTHHHGYLQNYLTSGNSRIIGTGREVPGRRKDGSIFPMELDICEIKGETRTFTGVVRDISLRKAHEERVHHLAHHDQLTGLPNRSLFFDRLAGEMSKARRTGKRAALLFMDLDGFKKINDDHGHAAGDVVLQTVANRWQACVREVDTIARMGGDEFAAVIGDVDNADEIQHVAGKLIAALSSDILLPNGQRCMVGTSVGIGIYPDNAANMDTLLVEADVAMYESKAKGKNTFTFASSKPANFERTGKWLVFNQAQLVGVQLIDEQHRELIRKLNHVNDAVTNKCDPNEIRRLIRELADYSAVQFETEQRLMHDYDYPHKADHLLQHEHLKHSLARVETDIFLGNEILALHKLRELHMEHIQNSDKLLGEYLASLGAA